MNTSQLKCACAIAQAIPEANRGPYPALLVCFDADRLAGIVPVSSWNYIFQDALMSTAYESAVLICYEPPPPIGDIMEQAAQCTVTYDGAVHDRPVRFLGLEYIADTPATGTTGLLH